MAGPKGDRLDLAGSSGLVEQEPGFWVAVDPAGEVSYPDEGHELSHAVSETSFWFRHRTACVLAAMRRFPPAGAVVDVGGGTGHLTAAIQSAGHEAVLVEPGGGGARLARTRGVRPVVHATLETAAFCPGSLPSVGLFDVVEHIADDVQFLARVRDLVAPGGRVYMTVPAHAWLWSVEDERAGHHRRYTRDGLAAVVAGAGLELDLVTYFFRPLPLPILLLRALPSRFGVRSGGRETTEREHATRGGLLSRIVSRSLAPEVARITNGRPMRVGASLLAVARRA